MFRHIFEIMGEELIYSGLCIPYAIRPGWRETRMPVLVNGSPKTGTTWLVRLLASLPTFVSVGNFGADLSSFAEVRPGDVIHGHYPYSDKLWELLTRRNVKLILTIRDPRDQLVSRMFHIRRDSTHAWHQRMQEMSDDEALMACIDGGPGMASLSSHLALTASWIQQTDKAMCVKYEDMLAAPVDEFVRVLEFLRIAIDRRLIHAIIARNRFERLAVGRRIWKTPRKRGAVDVTSHFRKGKAGDWMNYFTSGHVRRFKEIAAESLIAFGYESDTNWESSRSRTA